MLSRMCGKIFFTKVCKKEKKKNEGIEKERENEKFPSTYISELAFVNKEPNEPYRVELIGTNAIKNVWRNILYKVRKRNKLRQKQKRRTK